MTEAAVPRTKESQMPARRAVYTVLMGKYEQLNHSSARPSREVDFLCLTDDPDLTSETWTIVLVSPSLTADPVRSQRMLKIVGHPALDPYEETLYVDNSVLLLGDANAILDDWLGQHDMALHVHSYRTRLVDEFDEVLALNYDDAARVTEQLLHYAATDPEALEDQPLWTAIMARRNTPHVRAAMRTWCDHVFRYSRRDQLSVTLALRANELDTRMIHADNFLSPLHRWPVEVGRKVEQGKAPAYPAGPLLVEMARMERRAEAAERAAAKVTADTKTTIAELRDEVSAARASAAAALERERELRGVLDRTQTELDRLHSSSSWRLTAPARVLTRVIRGR